MKCLVLAGGSGDRLWPLSRKDFPKQFMEIREGRSMFQDTVLRNIPFCDEFIIITNKLYKNIVRGQLDVFNDLDYTIITEDATHKTAPPVIAYLLKCAPDDEICIMPSDCIIEGDYSATMTELKANVKENKFVAVTCKPKHYERGYNYISSGKVTNFGVKPVKGNLWDTGIWGAKAGVFLNSFKQSVVEKCRQIVFRHNNLDYSETKNFESISLIDIIENKHCVLLSASFNWFRITDISSFYNYYNKVVENNYNTISNGSKGVEIVNMVGEQLIVANGLKNTVIVNTRDAIYVSSKIKEADIKSISGEHFYGNKRYFDYAPKRYESWGVEELIGNAGDCSIKMVKIYSHETVQFKPNKNTVINIFIVEGWASVDDGNGEIEDYSEYQTCVLQDVKKYSVSNTGRSELVFICTEKKINVKDNVQDKNEYLVKLKPVFKDNLWGGTKIRDVFGKDVGNLEIIAESWELSAHPDGESRVENGEFAGCTLSEYINRIGKDRLGWKAYNYERFPLMIKFIDAKSDLSIQVHPSDDYAIEIEGDYGKNEMWHILDADDEAFIYIGFNKDVTKEEVRKRIKDNTLLQVLNKVYVKKGDTFFLRAGTVHAIGAGCLICEVQQSSNVTYRLYDYNRKDKNGNLRELHIDKALDVLNLKSYEPKSIEQYEGIMHSDYVKKLIGQCKYFVVNKYFIDGECSLPVIELSFQSIVILEGKGKITDGINTYTTKHGDTWFAFNKVPVTIKGKLTALVVNI